MLDLAELIYAPPWREWIGDELRGEQIVSLWHEYGPADSVAYEKQKHDWESRREGGGLWDVSEELAQKAKTMRARHERDRRVADYVLTHQWDIPHRELVCFWLLWEQKLSIKQAAKKMNVTSSTIQVLARRLTLRAAR